MLGHVKNLKSEVPTERTQNTLSELLNKFEELNILGDDRIVGKIDELRGVVNMRTGDIKETIMADLDYVLEQLEKF